MAGEDAAETWYVRARGRIQGPLTSAQLLALRDRGRLARFDQVSRDRRSWAPADSLEWLFPRAGAGGAFLPTAPAKERGPRRGSESESVEFLILDDDDGNAAGPGPASMVLEEPVGWYYAESGAPRGPVEYSDLRRLARDGRIGPGTLYWRSGLEQWMPGSVLPELNRLWLYEADPSDAASGVDVPRGQAAGPDPAMVLRVNPLAIASIALNLICGLGNLAAIVAGAVAWHQIARSNGALSGKRLAVVGMLLGITGLVIFALAYFKLSAKGIGGG